MDTIKNFKLANGVLIPLMGFGTWQLSEGDQAYSAVSTALELGYRHIDTANSYGNEPSVGKAVRDSGIARDEVFITSKLPAEIKDYNTALESFAQTLDNIGLDYIDLYLIHAPWPWEKAGEDFTQGNIQVWKALEEIYASGKCRAIGVSNFEVSDLKAIMENGTVAPMVNQIKFFIGYTQEDIISFCQQNNILAEGFSPLATGEILKNKNVAAIADKYEVSIAQLSIRYVLQRGVLPLPKSTTPARIQENKELDFEISSQDMAYLNSLENTVDKLYGPKRIVPSA